MMKYYVSTRWDESLRPIARLLTVIIQNHRLAAALVIISLILRVLAMKFAPLIPQEAYYWVYSQHPSLSYYDHPPMVALMIGLGTFLLGTNEVGVRVMNAIAVLCACGLMYIFSRLWFSRRVSLIAAIMLLTLPVFFAIGLVATMDGALLGFWLIALIGFTLSVKQERTSGWYLFGAATGAALLTKYTAIFLLVGAVLSLFLNRPWRKHLLKPHIYLAILLAFSIFTPVIWWNAENDWDSFRFQFVSRFSRSEGGAKTLLQFVFEQVVVASPLLLFGIGAVLMRAIRLRRLHSAEILAFAFGLPLLLITADKSLRVGAHINWTLPAYLSLLPIAIHFLIARANAWRRKGRSDHVSLGAVATIGAWINIALILVILILQPVFHWMTWFGPWDDLAHQVDLVEEMQENKDQQDPLVIVNGSFELASEIDFYRSKAEGHARAPVNPLFVDTDTITSQWFLSGEGLGYRYWDDTRDWQGKTCIFVDDHDGIEKRVIGRFASIQIIWSGKAANGMNYRIAVCKGFSGKSSR